MDGEGSSPGREAGARNDDPSPASAPSAETPLSKTDLDEIEDGPQSGFFSRIFSLLRSGPEGDGENGAERGEGEAEASRPRGRREMIERVMAFGEKRVYDVMAPRADIVAVDVDTPLDELIRSFAEAGHSRMPIYRGDLDDPIGMVHIKDVVGLIADPDAAKTADGPVLKKIRRDVLYVPPSMRITDLLLKMQASRIHMALVIDEYGGTDGLLTIEDLVEEIVGDINDEHDEDAAPIITPRAGGGWDADARVELDEFEAATGVKLETEDEEVNTLGGVVFSLAGRVPQRGEVIADEAAGLDFEVMEADARKVRRLRIRRRTGADKSDAAI
ncbi:MAG: hemolysin family protein [Pseudomonadota bacterium]|nr:hemolysin family protein [Pseudomonadota bacterium]